MEIDDIALYTDEEMSLSLSILYTLITVGKRMTSCCICNICLQNVINVIMQGYVHLCVCMSVPKYHKKYLIPT